MKRRLPAAAAAGSATGAGAAASEQLVDEESEPTTEELVRRAADGHVVGLSGLTEMMRQEPAPPGGRAMAAPAAGRPVAGRAAGRTAKRQARRRDSRVVYALFGGLGLMMACLGVALWLAVASDGWVVPSPTPVAPGEEAVGPNPPALSEAPLMYVQPMRAAPWRPVNGPYESGGKDGEAWLVDQARVFTGAAEERFTASIVTTSPDIIVAATVHVVLVDSDGDAVVRTQFPVALFGANRRQRIRISLPAGLPDGLLHVDAWVDIEQRMSGGIYLDQTSIVPLPDTSEQDMLVTVANTTQQPIEQMVVLITAADERNRPLARWHGELAQTVEPGKEVRVRVTLPRQEDAPDHWTVEAAAVPRPQPQTPPQAEKPET